MKDYKEVIKTFTEPNQRKFELRNIKFENDIFDELYLQDLMIYNDEIKEKLNRDVTGFFNNWVANKLKKKENVSLNIKGSTRSGKSLVALKHNLNIAKYYQKDFGERIEKIVCANQIEYRQKLSDAEFGDGFQIDENDFATVGIGSNIESMQLRDLQNIIAKKNIHTTYLTPKVFLNNVSEIGLVSFGKDLENWLSKFLLYSLKYTPYTLMGYVVFDVGIMFQEFGCFLYKDTGGCPNSNKKKISELDKELVNGSFCLPEGLDLNNFQPNPDECPFYDVCSHPLCKYEHKKDKWIQSKMVGGLEARERERYMLVFKLIHGLNCAFMPTENRLKLNNVKNFKEIKLLIKELIPSLTNMKLGIAEFDTLCDTFKLMFFNTDYMLRILKQVQDVNTESLLWSIENGEVIHQKFINFKEQKKITENEPK